MTRAINEAGLELIKSFESCSLTPYQDSAGIWTQGFGHTQGVTADSAPITEYVAEALLLQDLTTAENEVESHITVPLSDNQFAALVSLVFNCGIAPLVGHVGINLNNGDIPAALVAWLQYDHAGGVAVSGLERRREAEIALFNS